jgi:hypothetical protein
LAITTKGVALAAEDALDFLKRHVEADGTVQATAFTDPLQAVASAMQTSCGRLRDAKDGRHQFHPRASHLSAVRRNPLRDDHLDRG